MKSKMYQKTILRPISCTGIGVHSGEPAVVTLNPAPENYGIVFQRTDIKASSKETLIPARWQYVKRGDFSTKISNTFGHSISTIEHLMAAAAGYGITNLHIEVSGPEVPIMDGSAAPFLFLMECAGIKVQEAFQRYIKILKKITVRSDYGWASLSPARNFSAEATINFRAHEGMEEQSFQSSDLQECFREEIARARTYGFVTDIEKLRAAGLARGGSLDNAVVFDKGTILNPEGLRFENECVRHKVLDMIGDLFLAGSPILGHFEGKNFGHALNFDLLKALFSDGAAWMFHSLSSTSSEGPPATALFRIPRNIAVA